MFELKPLSTEAIPGALAKAERYRLLNEPAEAESICLDILLVDPACHDAMVTMILALSDEIHRDPAAFRRAKGFVPRLASPYDRAYYQGILWERRAKAHFEMAAPGARLTAADWIRHAMQLFEEAERVRPAGNDDALLRWNTCARFLMEHPDLAHRVEEAHEPIMSE